VSVVDFGWEPVWELPPVPEPPPRANGRAVLRRWLALGTLVAGVAGGGWLAFAHYETHLAGEQALEVAEAYVLRLTNIDADDVDRNFAAIADGSTGEFNAMHTRSGAKLRQLLIDNEATARGHVTEAVIKSAEKNHAVVVLLVNQAVRNAENPEPVIDRSRIRMTMDKVDGRWLASKVELV
jgi:Mce-associated membrane protein